MNSRDVALTLFAVAIAVTAAACGPAASPTPAPPTPTSMPSPTEEPTPTGTPIPVDLPLSFQESFEQGLDPWQKGADVPEDPDRPGEPVAWTIELSSDEVLDGDTAARFFLDGSQDDGTIWLMRPFDVAADGAVRVHLTFDLWSASESFNTLAKVSAYAGAQAPVEEADFDVSQAANLAEGWHTYEYAFDVELDDDQVWVALGISAVWETEMTYYVDDVRIDIAEADAGEPSQAELTIAGVEVTDQHVVIRGETTLSEGACVNTELWADGEPVSWWPTEACAAVRDGSWELLVPLDADQQLESGVQYMARAYQPGGPQIVSTFPFNLDAPPSPAPGDDATLILPESAVPVHRASGDLDGDGTTEEVVLTGWGGAPDTLGYDFLQLFVITTDDDGEYVVAWQSEQLPTERAEALRTEDINGDGLPEVLSVQAMGAAGETLYVLSWRDGAYGWLAPQGGEFDGQDAFGETGVRVEDQDGDGILEILADYGPASQYTDVYAWDGEAYVYEETLGETESGVQRVQVPEVGLSLELPADWTETAPGSWAAPDQEELRLGVQAVDLEPGQEPEAVLLPGPSQVVESVPLKLPWGDARRVVLEVYEGEPEEGEQAPVASVEAHVLAVVDQAGGRLGIDIYAAAPTAEELAALEPTLQHALKTVVLRLMTRG